MASRWRSFAGAVHNRTPSRMSSVPTRSGAAINSQSPYPENSDSTDVKSRHRSTLQDVLDIGLDEKHSSQILGAENGVRERNLTDPFYDHPEDDTDFQAHTQQSFTGSSFCESFFSSDPSQLRPADGQATPQSQTADYDLGHSAGVIDSQNVLWNSSADVSKNIYDHLGDRLEEEMVCKELGTSGMNQNSQQLSSQLSMLRNDLGNCRPTSNDRNVSQRGVDGVEFGQDSAINPESVELKNVVSIEGRISIPDSQETLAEASTLSNLSNINLSGLIFESSHSHSNDLSTPSLPGNLPVPNIPSSTQPSDMMLMVADEFPPLSSLPEVPFQSNQQLISRLFDSFPEQLSTSQPASTSQSQWYSKPTSRFRKRLLSSPGFESPDFKRPRVEPSRRTTEPEDTTSQVIDTPMRFLKATPVSTPSPPASTPAGLLDMSVRTFGDEAQNMSNLFSTQSQRISYLSMNLSEDLKFEEDAGDVSYMAELQKRDFFSTQPIPEEPDVPNETASVLGDFDDGFVPVSPDSALVKSRSRLVAYSPSTAPISPKSPIAVFNSTGLVLPPFCVLLPTRPRQNRPVNHSIVVGVSPTGKNGNKTPCLRPTKPTSSLSQTKTTDPRTARDLHSLFRDTYPSYTIPLKPFRVLCRKLASIRTVQSEGHVYPPEELYDAYVLNHVPYDRLCLKWMQTGKPVVPYSGYLKDHPLEKKDTRGVINLRRLKMVGFC